MSQDRIAARVEDLRVDFAQVTGAPFRYFFCPLLFRDEATRLCQGHVVNDGFNASNAWTVQREDIDNWYGSRFEGDFLALRFVGLSAQDVVVDRAASAALRPRFVVGGRTVAHYVVQDGEPPPQYSSVWLPVEPKPVRIAVKMPPAEFQTFAESDWEVVYEKDLTMPAVIALTKAAHLTLFRMLGYGWALSRGGRFIGTALGDLYIRHKDLSRPEVLANSGRYFDLFAPLVRPVSTNPAFLGTVDDHALTLVQRGDLVWAMLILIRTGPKALHAVLVPTLDPGTEPLYREFVGTRGAQEIVIRRILFRGDHWEAPRETETLVWPPTEPAPTRDGAERHVGHEG